MNIMGEVSQSRRLPLSLVSPKVWVTARIRKVSMGQEMIAI